MTIVLLKWCIQIYSTIKMFNYIRNPILTCYRRPLRRAHYDQEDEESQEEVQEVSEGEGL